MISYRSFLNTDPPHLAEVWRGQSPMRGLVQSISAGVLEKHIFSKTYFDRDGLIVAEEDNRVVGFAHGGFGPSDDRSTLGQEVGVVSRLMVLQHERREEIAGQLLDRVETYLTARSIRTLVAGGFPPNNPFYLGLYGGSRLPGILREDEFTAEQFRNRGYERVGEQLILQCRLPGFRPPVNRGQMMVRRRYQIMAAIDPMPETWWDACTLGMTDRTRFLLVDRQDGDTHGHVTFWDLEPLASSWGVHAMGLYDLFIEPSHRRQGLATFLICESIRQLQRQGITIAEFQTRASDDATTALFDKLGFDRVDHGLLLAKSVVPADGGARR